MTADSRSGDDDAMPESTRKQLVRALQERYAEIKARLSRNFAPDLVEDAMHETWLRLQRPRDLNPVRDPENYVAQAVANTAKNLRTSQERLLDFTDLSALFTVVDDAPGPEIIAGDRREVERLQAALAELTERQQDIFYETFIGDQSHHALAERYGVTLRTVQKELKRAIEHCARRLGKRKSFATAAPKLSSKQGETK
ncbi:sigma-70 family RNA polymerase sigma factor [Sandaracinobacter sp. RS1-74]|uniref:RNA polymerase sigma factor n=1 Tax=Sandaracinobacteroides sayramensis TaxID=2913411 RepID=UPI001EDACB7E|nr:sigma-70 family RNA polymerase sigma factor [Sandaracinobacteroides sayramensis]MCG2841234.1 sigma-70 family RNA polymerase sigma factor [Sandaracinobacteroides sayramensis]